MSKDSSFPETIIGKIEEAREGDKLAIAHLYNQYGPPLRAIFFRRFRNLEVRSTADDFVNDFFLHKILPTADGDPGAVLKRWEKKKGRFRSYLATAFIRFLCSKATQTPRTTSLDEPIAEALPQLASHETQELDNIWVQTVFEVSWTQFEETCRTDYVNLFRMRFIEPLRTGQPAPTIEKLAEITRSTPGKITGLLRTAKKKYDDVLRQTLAEITGCASDEELDEEFRKLDEIFSSEDTLLPIIKAISDGPDLDGSASHSTLGTTVQNLSQFIHDSGLNREQYQLQSLFGQKLNELACDEDSIVGKAVGDDPIEIETLGEIFHHPRPPMFLLKAIKRMAKKYFARQSPMLSSSNAKVLYFAVVATTIVRYGVDSTRRISSLSFDELETNLSRALKREENQTILLSLFHEAIDSLKNAK